MCIIAQCTKMCVNVVDLSDLKRHVPVWHATAKLQVPVRCHLLLLGCIVLGHKSHGPCVFQRCFRDGNCASLAAGHLAWSQCFSVTLCAAALIMLCCAVFGRRLWGKCMLPSSFCLRCSAWWWTRGISNQFDTDLLAACQVVTSTAAGFHVCKDAA